MVKSAVKPGIFIHHRGHRGHRVFMKDISCLYPFASSKQFAHKRFLVFVLCALCVLCGEISAQDFRTVHPGVEYAKVDHKIGTDPVIINLLRLDLTKVRLDVHHALDKAIGLETTSSIAARGRAVAAINAGFFRLDKSALAGEAADYLVIDGELFSEGNRGRVGLHITNDKKKTNTAIEHFNINGWLGSSDSRFTIKLSGVNRERSESEFILYTSRFGASTLTREKSTEIIIGNCQRGTKRFSFLKYCKDYRVLNDVMDTPIPVGGYVVSMSPGQFRNKVLFLNELKTYEALANKKKSLFLKIEDSISKYSLFSEEQDLVAGAPQLVKNGKIDITWEQEKASKAFVETRHPRTAVAKLKDGKFLMLTVDGRQPGVSVGMNLNELADYLLSLGAVDAMNLDGGGSTTMFLDGKVVNKPSDPNGERKIGDAILVTLRKKG